MSLSDLPQPIKTFLQATANRNRAAVMASFADDAVLVDMGKDHRGEDIARWMTASILAPTSGFMHSMPSSATDTRS